MSEEADPNDPYVDYPLHKLFCVGPQSYEYHCHHKEGGREHTFNKGEEESRDLAASTSISLSTTELPSTGAFYLMWCDCRLPQRTAAAPLFILPSHCIPIPCIKLSVVKPLGKEILQADLV